MRYNSGQVVVRGAWSVRGCFDDPIEDDELEEELGPGRLVTTEPADVPHVGYADNVDAWWVVDGGSVWALYAAEYDARMWTPSGMPLRDADATGGVDDGPTWTLHANSDLAEKTVTISIEEDTKENGEPFDPPRMAVGSRASINILDDAGVSILSSYVEITEENAIIDPLLLASEIFPDWIFCAFGEWLPSCGRSVVTGRALPRHLERTREVTMK